MFRWLNRRPKIQSRSAKRYDRLTEDEKLFMKWAFLNEEYECPDCEKGHLLPGPTGGCSNNVMCNYCTSEFNLTFFFSDVLGERISDAQAGDAQRMSLYGIIDGKV